jgi:hypothetical protein
MTLPQDFERRPEFRQLAQLCGGEVTACYLFLRLWVELAYHASLCDKPGQMSPQAAKLYEVSVPKPDASFLSEYRGPLEWMVECGLLVRDGNGYFCDLFHRMNPQLARDFVPYGKRANRLSLINRRRKQIDKLADSTALLLPPEAYRRRDGSPMDAALANAVRVLIITLDRCLERPPRKPAEWGEGLIADAAEVASTRTPEQLNAFYRWLIVNHEHPAVPPSAERLLADFDRVERMGRQ